jgi:hypothetical protein
MRCRLYGLYALISVHFRKEDLQLPAFDAAPAVAERVLARMGEAAGNGHPPHTRHWAVPPTSDGLG